MIRHAGRRGLPGLLLVFLCACADSDPAGPVDGPFAYADLTETWRTAEPAHLEFDPARLGAAVEEAEEIPRLTSLLVARRGRLVLERYYLGRTAESRHDVRDVTGAVVSALAGVALERGELEGVDERVEELLGHERSLTGHQREITVEHLLTMTSGFEWNERTGDSYLDWIRSRDRVSHLLSRPHAGAPGSAFEINSAAVHLLGIALERATGRSLPEYARAHLFEPAGIRSARWESFGGFTNLGSGLELRSRDLLRLGQLFLQAGVSGSHRVLPEGWVERATRSQVPWAGDTFGPLRDVTFGYLWWLDDAPARPAFLAWGFGGQFVYVVPDLALVAVTTTSWRTLFMQEPVVRSVLEAALLKVLVDGIAAAAR